MGDCGQADERERCTELEKGIGDKYEQGPMLHMHEKFTVKQLLCMLTKNKCKNGLQNISWGIKRWLSGQRQLWPRLTT